MCVHIPRINNPMSPYMSENLAKYDAPHPIMQYLISRFQRRFFGLLKKADPKTVLEVGCGEGFLLNYIAGRDARLRLSGVDLSYAAVHFARDRFALNSGLLVGSVYDLPFRAGVFDLVVCSEVLEHLSDVQCAVAELQRISARHVLISVPLEPYFRFFTDCAVRLRLGENPAHIQFWSSQDFTRFVHESFPIVLAVERCFPYQMALCESQR